jgi:hypothetical protein
MILCLENWEELQTLSKKFDLLCLVKETAETQVHELVGAKYKSDHVSETHIEFNIATAMGGIDKLKEFFGEAHKGEEFYRKMLELYQQNGIHVWYAKAK